jgi:hypothetical protein
VVTEVQQDTTPSDLLDASNTSATTADGTTVDPALSSSSPDTLTSTGSAVQSSIPVAGSGGFSLGTGATSICISPATSGATPAPGEVVTSGGAAVFANTAPSTSTVVRPTATGVETWDVLANASAPTDIPWDVTMPTGDQLEELPGGQAAAIVDPSLAPSPNLSGDVAGAPDGSSVTSASTQLYDETSTIANAQTDVTDGAVVAVLADPSATDANGMPEPTTLTANPITNTVDFSINPLPGSTYPITADPAATAGTNAIQDLAESAKKNVCSALTKVNPPADDALGVTPGDAAAACNAIQSDMNADKNLSLWELSQVIAATLDVGWWNPLPNQNVYSDYSYTRRNAYATQVQNALVQYACHDTPTLPAGPTVPTSDRGPNCYSKSQSRWAGLMASTKPGSIEYYDDNAEAGDDLVEAYRWSCQDPAKDPAKPSGPTCNKDLLTAAEKEYDFETTGKVPITAGINYGTGPGIHWFFTTPLSPKVNRGAVANADAAMFATSLHNLDNGWSPPSGIEDPGTFAQHQYDFVRTVLQRPTVVNWRGFPTQANDPLNGLFWDHATLEGCFRVNCYAPAEAQSYASGLMIGDAMNLANSGAAANYANKADGYFKNYYVQEPKESPDARGLVDTMVPAPQGPNPNGLYAVLEDNLEATCPAINALYFHWLRELDVRDNTTIYDQPKNQIEQDYLTWILDPNNDLGASFKSGKWTKPKGWQYYGQNGNGAPGCGKPAAIMAQIGVTRLLIDAVTENPGQQPVSTTHGSGY